MDETKSKTPETVTIKVEDSVGLNPNRPKFICGDCGVAYRKVDSLNKHYADYHIKDFSACKICTKEQRCERHSTYFNWQTKSRDPTSYRCPHCPQAFNTLGKLNSHWRDHGPCICSCCSRFFAGALSLRGHRRSRRKSKSAKQPKNVSIEELRSLQQDLFSQSRKRTGIPAFSENARVKDLKTEDESLANQFARSDVEDRSSCNYSTQEQQCERHAASLDSRKKSEEPTPHKCSDCPQSFRSLKTLTSHRSKLHKVEHYKCPYCPQSFRKRKLLILHRSDMHEDEHTNAVRDARNTARRNARNTARRTACQNARRDASPSPKTIMERCIEGMSSETKEELPSWVQNLISLEQKIHTMPRLPEDSSVIVENSTNQDLNPKASKRLDGVADDGQGSQISPIRRDKRMGFAFLLNDNDRMDLD